MKSSVALTTALSGAYLARAIVVMIIVGCHHFANVELPHWMRFRSMHWGSASPFSVGWWAIVQDDHALANAGIVLPRGCMVRYREWYGMRAGEPNVGSQRLGLLLRWFTFLLANLFVLNLADAHA